jgi:ABC-type phosphate transport system permease subunit
MIQRPQSLFLALVILANSIATSGISIWQKIGTSGQKAELFSNQWQLFQNGKEVAAHSTIAIALLVTLSTIIT